MRLLGPTALLVATLAAGFPGPEAGAASVLPLLLRAARLPAGNTGRIS